MARWSEFEADAPELAVVARRFLDTHVHKVLATIRRDGSPRVSGTECAFKDGDLWFGSMWQATKALDLRRDPRFALHSGSDEPDSWKGDVKVAGTVEEITDPDRMREIYPEVPDGPMHVFRADVTEVVVISLPPSREHLVIESWRPGRGISRFER